MIQLKIGEIKIKQTTLVGEGQQTNPYYVFGETIDETIYNDITSNYNWMNVGSIDHDYLFCRNQVLLLTNELGWDNLSIIDKRVAAEVFIVDKTKRDQVLTENDQKIYWGILVTNSQNTRFKRWEEAKKYISYVLSPVDASDLGKSTSELCNDYINYNIITKVKDGISGLFDYLKGEGDFVGSGFPSKSYWAQTLQDNLLDILENGNY